MLDFCSLLQKSALYFASQIGSLTHPTFALFYPSLFLTIPELDQKSPLPFLQAVGVLQCFYDFQLEGLAGCFDNQLAIWLVNLRIFRSQ